MPASQAWTSGPRPRLRSPRRPRPRPRPPRSRPDGMGQPALAQPPISPASMRRALEHGVDADGRRYTDFEFGFPLHKSEGASDDNMRVCGLASCEDRDLQGEEVIQKGLDFAPALASGSINWDHRETPDCLIGYPTHLAIVQAHEHPRLTKAGVKGAALYAEGVLYKGHP